MARRMLMDVTWRPGCVLVLRHMMRAAGALRRVADKMQGSEDAVAEKQRPCEKEQQVRLSDRTREQAVSQAATV
jgi:hypothetical protein